MLYGKVKFFRADLGYGFIMRDDGQADAFVGISDLRKSGLERLKEDARVRFDTAPCRNGRERAVQIEVIE